MDLELPEKRTAVLYTRIKEKNKEFVSLMSEKLDVSESVFVDQLIEAYRKDNVSYTKKSRKGRR